MIIIRSQDRDVLVDAKMISAFSGTGGIPVGKYASHERYLEIIDEIQKKMVRPWWKFWIRRFYQMPPE